MAKAKGRRDARMLEGVSKGQLLLNLIQDLEPHGLVVLHGYETYPYSIPSDVDVLGTPEVLTVLKKLVAQGKYRVAQVIQHEATCYYWVIWAWGREGKPIFLQLDYAADYRRDGRIFYRAEDLLPYRRWHVEGIPVLPPALEFGYYVVKKVGKGTLEGRHLARLTALFQEDPEGCRRELVRFFPEREASLIARAAAAGDWSEVHHHIRSLKQAMLRKVGAYRPWDVAQYYVGELRRWVARILRPTGLVVTFLGMDGSGKSTVATRVREGLAPAFRRTKVVHLRPSLREKSVSGSVTAPHSKPPRGLLVSLAKLGYWWVEYWLGWGRKVYPDKVRSTFVVFDRYYHDLLVDSRRYRYGGPMWLARFVARFVPRPDLFIFLDLPAEVAHDRKPEVALEESQRLRECYLELARSLPNAYVVDASKPLDEVVRDVERIILDYMTERTKKRLLGKKPGLEK